jgi:hypothetical protein
MRTHLPRLALLATAAALLGLLPGCSTDRTAARVAAMNTANGQRLANIYSAFQNYQGRGPRDETDFKAFIKAFDPAKLTMMGIDASNLDALFTSERDRQPFKIRYGIGGGRGSVAAVVFEQAGSGGKKQVAFTGNSKLDEVDDATYAELWAGRAAPGAPIQTDTRPAKGMPDGAQTGPTEK